MPDGLALIMAVGLIVVGAVGIAASMADRRERRIRALQEKLKDRDKLIRELRQRVWQARGH